MDFALARIKMIESQVRPNGVTDERVIAAMSDLPREDFVPPAYRALAYMDEDLALDPSQPYGSGRCLLEPMTLARLLQLLNLDPEGKILDVGCSTGYSTAILASLAKTVIALECDKDLAAQARDNLAKFEIGNASVVTGRLADGWLVETPFDAILVNGRVPDAPLALLAQLKQHGRLSAVVGRTDTGRATVFTRNGTFSSRSAFDAFTSALPGFEAEEQAFDLGFSRV